MPTFTITILLAALNGPQVYFFLPALQFKDQAACERALPAVEKAVAAAVRASPDGVQYLGNLGAKVTRSYWVASSTCDPDAEEP